MKSGLTKEIATFCYKFRFDQLPAEVVEKVKVCTLHGICVGLAGVDRPTAQQALRLVKKIYSQESIGTRLLIDGTKIPIIGSTFANSVLLHSRLQEDDFHEGLIHLGVVVLPAALALAELNQRSGKDFITAVALGYEIGARISQYYTPLSLPRGFRSTSLYGPIAAGIASAKLLNLNEEQITSTLGWAANCGGGLLECGIAQTISEMPFQAGFASSAGLMAALLAREGAFTAPTLLEGERGFLQGFAGSNEGMERITIGLGRQYFMLNTFFKRYPIGGLLQAPVLAMLSLMQEHDINPLKIRQIEVRMNPIEALYPGANNMKHGPMSLQYCLSMAACERKITTTAIDGIINPCISNLMSKIKVIPDESISPLHCKLSVNMMGEGNFDKYINFDTKSFSFFEEKELVKSLIPEMKKPEKRIIETIEMLSNLEDCEDITSFMDLLVSP